MALPILYSYRRCPYAMRARMALKYAGITVEIREVSLKDKPAHLLQISPKGTVPVLLLDDGQVIDQSLEIMYWALRQRDIEGWLNVDRILLSDLVQENDGSFKQSLDRYKYAIRFPEASAETYRKAGEVFLAKLEQQLTQHHFLISAQPSLADIAIFPFIRQFSGVDVPWFATADYPKLKMWLSFFVESELFYSIMQKQLETTA